MEDENDSETGIMFYRCNLCGKALAPWVLSAARACPRCGHTRVRPTNLSWWEKTLMLMRYPRFWSWEQ